MKCPYCKQEMIEGYIQSSEHIYFNVGAKARFFPAGDLKSRSLTKFSIRSPHIKGYMCNNCEKIILDVKKENRKRRNEKNLFKI